MLNNSSIGKDWQERIKSVFIIRNFNYNRWKPRDTRKGKKEMRTENKLNKCVVQNTESLKELRVREKDVILTITMICSREYFPLVRFDPFTITVIVTNPASIERVVVMSLAVRMKKNICGSNGRTIEKEVFILRQNE